ncbi:DUF4386 domain-containing protein [Nocardia sp. BMG51109]|uniref:DUF4386 domain-containing protein n=1 Tax=Nocardia sp. BMG51109 TaxID=1056816 RepID=UPI00068787EC|nr:DUF4386 domain-containing protein [Nocardia sp. BMG51109]
MDLRQRLARASGLLYLVIAVCGLCAPLAFGDTSDPVAAAADLERHHTVFAAGVVGWTVLVLADTAVAVTLYLLLRPVAPTLAAITAALRLVYSAMLGACLIHLGTAFSLRSDPSYRHGLDPAATDTFRAVALSAFDTGFRLALIVFGVHCLGLGMLFRRARYIPRLLAALLLAAGIGYITTSLLAVLALAADGELTSLLLVPALVGELGLTFWLLVKGVDGRAPSRARVPTPAAE